MILDIARLLLFPALMAFAAASDLFTMTICASDTGNPFAIAGKRFMHLKISRGQ